MDNIEIPLSLSNKLYVIAKQYIGTQISEPNRYQFESQINHVLANAFQRGEITELIKVKVLKTHDLHMVNLEFYNPLREFRKITLTVKE